MKLHKLGMQSRAGTGGDDPGAKSAAPLPADAVLLFYIFIYFVGVPPLFLLFFALHPTPLRAFSRSLPHKKQMVLGKACKRTIRANYPAELIALGEALTRGG